MRKAAVLLALAVLASCQGAGPSDPSAKDARTAALLASVKVPPSAQFIGKDRSSLTSILGEPSLVRRETGVEVLQFSNGACVLIAYLYASEERAFRIRHLEAVGAGGGRFKTDGCLLEQARAQVLKTSQ